ncbi:hypothetical protein [Methylophilus sp. YYY-1]|uniref:hypothetical protein n=1 Tax=Methylophilus sp. YYY-1 TaxID=2682087 RepID=UPI0023B24662|nr:hypothetical protein [Methylophilus sp. YYY-1]MDF0377698.1 hypothetical protein [Methylophilus sp. YYY-1]
MITIKDILPVGVEHNGKVHRDFELRPAKLLDNIEAIEELGDQAASALRLGTAILARQIVSIGDIPRELITTDFVYQLLDVDYDALEKARESLQKKLIPPKAPSKKPE